ncbi:NAD(P)/FAD-dependent oxidoreductase [Legionella sp. MW5194]|uniref:NAD(P)/FAD-dependent oxidoreductase n=1 Tax=Legionella sp. MW5194 TaxID=2662448 RepID=UPI00193CF6C9|nr:NAD(P)/FAD-dependent oxidoreductase [Legionella sp. MW5194]
MNPDILVIGAGPIGLLSAIEAKLHNPEAEVVIFERNKEYTRHHTLLVDRRAFNGSHP